MNPDLKFSRRMLAALFALGAAACTPDAPAPQVPVSAEAAAPRIVLDAAQRRAAGVEVAAAAAQSIAERLDVYGEVRPVAERLRQIVVRYPGIARHVAKKVGDTVTAGETLLVVESNDSLEPYRIRAPIAGRVLARAVNEGEMLGDQVLFTIGDLSRVWVEFDVFAHDVSRVAAGQAIEMMADGARDAQRAVIDYVAAAADPGRRSVKVRATLDNADGRWRPGQFVQGAIVLAEHRVAVAVPVAALQQIDGRPSVFVEQDGGFVARPVVLGAQDRRHAEIREGLTAGERVVVSNSFLLKSQWLASGEE